MSFLSRLGLKSVYAVEGPHGRTEEQVRADQQPIEDKTELIVYKPPSCLGMPIHLAAKLLSNCKFALDWGRITVPIFVDRVLENGTVIFQDFDCPDCEGEACSHCELEHVSTRMFRKVRAAEGRYFPGLISKVGDIVEVFDGEAWQKASFCLPGDMRHGFYVLR